MKREVCEKCIVEHYGEVHLEFFRMDWWDGICGCPISRGKWPSSEAEPPEGCKYAKEHLNNAQSKNM